MVSVFGIDSPGLVASNPISPILSFLVSLSPSLCLFGAPNQACCHDLFLLEPLIQILLHGLLFGTGLGSQTFAWTV